MKKLLIILTTGIYIFALVNFSKILSADLKYIKSKRFIKERELSTAINLINKSIKKNPKEPRYYYEKAKLLIALKKENEALENLQKAEESNKNNLVSLRNMIPIYYFVPKNEAQKYYQKLKNKYSNDAGLLVQIAKYEKKLDLTKDYNKSIETIKDLRPGLVDWAL